MHPHSASGTSPEPIPAELGRILAAASRAFSPGRLWLAFVAVVLLCSVGRGLDLLWAPVAPPEGLLSGRWDSAKEDHAQRAMRVLVMAHIGRDRWSELAASGPVRAEDARAALVLAATGAEGRLAAPGEFERVSLALDALRPRRPFEALVEASTDAAFQLARGVVALRPGEALRGLEALCVAIPRSLWLAAPGFTAVFSVLTLLIIGILGGAICRMAACDHSDRPAGSWKDGLRYALQHWRACALAPLAPLAMAGVLAGIIWIGGLPAGLPVANMLAAAWFGLALVLSLLALIAVTLCIVGLPMYLGTISAEGCDGLEAFQRSGAYVLEHPLHAALYAATAAVAFGLGLAVADVALAATFNLALDLWSDPAGTAHIPYLVRDAGVPSAPGGAMGWNIAALLYSCWRLVLTCLVGAAALSLVLHLGTRMYLLLRRRGNGQSLTEIEEG